jgi:hypothetical protein
MPKEREREKKKRKGKENHRKIIYLIFELFYFVIRFSRQNSAPPKKIPMP